MNDTFKRVDKENEPPELDFIPEILIRINGADPKYVVENCPDDIGNLMAGGIIGVGSCVYNTTMFCIAATHFNGSLNFGILIGSAALAGYTLANDSYIFNRCSHLTSGFQQIGEPIPRKISKMARRSLGLRVLQSCVLGTVFAITTSLVLYKDDIKTRIRQDWLQTYAARLGQLGEQTDAGVKIALEAVNQATTNIASLNKQISARLARNANAANLEKQRAAQERNLTVERAELTKLQNGRNSTLRTGLTEDPTTVHENFGVLAQIDALEKIAGDDWKIAFVIFLIDFIFMGFDLSPVLAKLNWLPTKYAALKARDFIGHRQRIMAPTEPENSPNDQPYIGPANDNSHFTDEHEADTPFANDNDPFPEPVKRKRGRPRKYPPPAINGSGGALPEE